MSQLQPSDTVAIIGAGTMGAGIAQVAANAGHQVYLFDINPDAVEQGINFLKNGLAKQVKRGKMTDEEVEAIIGRILPCSDLSDLKDSKLIIEAIVEKLEIKQSLFSDLEEICGDETIFATNTSSISITSIASKLKKPERLVGMHFFNPAPILKLVEIVSGLASDKSVLEKIYNTAQNWGKTPVYVKSTPGFIVNRVARPFYAEALRVLDEGAADVITIDRTLKELGGFRMGSFELMDLIGHDVNYAVTESVFSAFYHDGRFKPSLSQLELVNAGFLGRKSGRGFYDYNNIEDQTSIKNEPSFPAPQKITVYGDLGVAEKLIDRAMELKLDIIRRPSELNRSIVIDGVNLYMTNGCAATEKAANSNLREVVLFDLALDYSKTKRIILTKAEQTSLSSLKVIIGFFQSLGIDVTIIKDIPGMIVSRTVSMIINEAADTVYYGVATMDDIDLAMCKGVNYPIGPFSWADKIGVKNIYVILQNLLNSYGEDRYRPSPLLRQKFYANTPFNAN